MHRNDLEELFATVQVGDQVEIRSEDDLEIASVFADPQDTQTATDEPAAAMGQ